MKFTPAFLSGCYYGGLTAAAALGTRNGGLTVARPPTDPYFLANAPTDGPTDLKIPTSRESAVLGRRILALTPLGTLATVFPHDENSNGDGQGGGDAEANENRPPGLGGVPIGLMDYFADCEEGGNPTLLAIDIATQFRNVAAGSNISLAVRWAPPYPPSKRISDADASTTAPPSSASGSAPHSRSSVLHDPLGHLVHRADNGSGDGDRPEPIPYSAANLPRFSLVGYLEDITEGTDALSKCFVATHPDAKYWLPGNPIHKAHFTRLVPTQIYWVGGFGDRAYIGWISIEEWRNVTRAEWQAAKLPGEEKGWSEWSAGPDL